MRAVLAAVSLAAASTLVVAPAPGYDAWAWLLWGRELTWGELSTTEGPAFKPLPVAVCAALAPLGWGAVWGWIVLVRAAAVLAVLLAFRTGRQLADGSRTAGVLAAAGVALCSGFALYAATGAEAPVVVALALAGAQAWRGGRPGAALACAVAACLLRVEAWPFALALGLVLWRRRGIDRRLLAGLALAVPVAWFVPEQLGSGDVLRSGARARVPNPGQPALADFPAFASLSEAAELALWPLVAGAAYALARPGGARAWAAAGLAWVLLVAAMAQAGFSGEPRYALPGAAAIAVAGAAGLVRAGRGTAVAAAALVLACAAVGVAALSRLDDVGRLPGAQAHHWRLATQLDEAIATAGGRGSVLACGTPYVGPFRGPILAYGLRVAKRRVEPDDPPAPPGVVFRSRLTPFAPPEPEPGPGFRPGGRAGPWEVYVRCGVREP